MKENFGEYIRKLRKQKKYTLTQLAAKLGIDSGALSKIENSKRKLDEKLLPILANIFDLDLETIKDEYISERIAYTIYENGCSDKIYQLAEQKVRYIKQRKVKQGKLEL
ncbi:helix-turn-helix domain-containing protein [Lutibacter sp.]